MLVADHLRVQTLGAPMISSPLCGDTRANFVTDDTFVRYQVEIEPGQEPQDDCFFEKAGPRQQIFFEPTRTKAAIVTCGGLCPGLNNVIRSLVLQLYHVYGVRDVVGFRYGYHGFNPKAAKPPVPLTPEMVATIHHEGGTFLGSSRGPEDMSVIVDTLVRERINILFTVGGDGTQRGAHAIVSEISRRGLPIAVVGIPKTIDNDIPFVYRSFGFSTAIEKAKEVIDCAHAEAQGAPNGISLVKLMGRDAGFIAAGATLASQEVNFTLIPEVPFDVDGDRGFMSMLRDRILARGHAVVVIAEGAGQHLIKTGEVVRDASGNVKQREIGLYLRNTIQEYFNGYEIPINLKYFDPSYLIRSVPANSDDSYFCYQLARHAAHAAMAGKTDLVIGLWYNMFVHVPIPLITREKKRISPKSELWTAVLNTTGQPAEMCN
ncbi:MAG: ATP-dependent 6-phosphofructokinase [Blastocatellia bacterium]|nr:ATP-dependent 6-phosphofructokinase [Blastocatellia bacterium]